MEDIHILIWLLEYVVHVECVDGLRPSSPSGDVSDYTTVHANVSGILRIACDKFDDDSGGVWKISTSSSAVLEIEIIDTVIALLEGDWTIEDDATLDVDSEGFQTDGSLSWKGGTIDVADGCIADFGQRP